MATESVEVLIQGGKATAAPPLGPALGPLGVNIGQVVSDINKKTASFKGMQVPVKVEVDTSTKEFTISIGTPPTSGLIKKEAGIQKGASNPLIDKVADLKIEQIIKIADMKKDAILAKNNMQAAKEIMGTCQSMGILVEGVPANEAIARLNAGEWKSKIESGKTDLTEDELKALEEERIHLKEEMAVKNAEFKKQADVIMGDMKNKDNSKIRKKMFEAGIPDSIINDLAPEAK